MARSTCRRSIPSPQHPRKPQSHIPNRVQWLHGCVIPRRALVSARICPSVGVALPTQLNIRYISPTSNPTSTGILLAKHPPFRSLPPRFPPALSITGEWMQLRPTALWLKAMYGRLALQKGDGMMDETRLRICLSLASPSSKRMNQRPTAQSLWATKALVPSVAYGKASQDNMPSRLPYSTRKAVPTMLGSLSMVNSLMNG